jgi:hypothetical protein
LFILKWPEVEQRFLGLELFSLRGRVLKLLDLSLRSWLFLLVLMIFPLNQVHPRNEIWMRGVDVAKLNIDEVLDQLISLIQASVQERFHYLEQSVTQIIETLHLRNVDLI